MKRKGIKQLINELKRRKLQVKLLSIKVVSASRDKEDIMKLASKGSEPAKPTDILHTPYVMEFTGLDDKAVYHESDLETAVIGNLQDFLLEMGKGFLLVEISRSPKLDIDL